jgi:hypothetical protein
LQNKYDKRRIKQIIDGRCRNRALGV